MQQSNQTASLEAYLHHIVSAGRVSHAYLLEVPRLDTGLEIALDFARLLLCDSATGCGTCKNCQMAMHLTHPDIQIIRLPEDKKQISVAQIRDVVSESYIKPYMGKRKIVVFPDSALMTVQAQNALLKVLEEPPGDVVFLLLCTNHMQLLETIRSRTTLLQLQQMQMSAEDIDLESDVREQLFAQAQKLAGGNLLDLYTVADYFGVRDRKNRKEKGMLSLSFQYLLTVFRELLLIKLDCDDLVHNSSALLRQLAVQTSAAQILRVMEQLTVALRRLERNVQYDLLIMSLLYSCTDSK